MLSLFNALLNSAFNRCWNRKLLQSPSNSIERHHYFQSLSLSHSLSPHTFLNDPLFFSFTSWQVNALSFTIQERWVNGIHLVLIKTHILLNKKKKGIFSFSLGYLNKCAPLALLDSVYSPNKRGEIYWNVDRVIHVLTFSLRTGLRKTLRSSFPCFPCLKWRCARTTFQQQAKTRNCVWSYNVQRKARISYPPGNAKQDAKTSTGRASLPAEALVWR